MDIACRLELISHWLGFDKTQDFMDFVTSLAKKIETECDNHDKYGSSSNVKNYFNREKQGRNRRCNSPVVQELFRDAIKLRCQKIGKSNPEGVSLNSSASSFLRALGINYGDVVKFLSKDDFEIHNLIVAHPKRRLLDLPKEMVMDDDELERATSKIVGDYHLYRFKGGGYAPLSTSTGETDRHSTEKFSLVEERLQVYMDRGPKILYQDFHGYDYRGTLIYSKEGIVSQTLSSNSTLESMKFSHLFWSLNPAFENVFFGSLQRSIEHFRTHSYRIVVCKTYAGRTARGVLEKNESAEFQVWLRKALEPFAAEFFTSSFISDRGEVLKLPITQSILP